MTAVNLQPSSDPTGAGPRWGAAGRSPPSISASAICHRRRSLFTLSGRGVEGRVSSGHRQGGAQRITTNVAVLLCQCICSVRDGTPAGAAASQRPGAKGRRSRSYSAAASSEDGAVAVIRNTAGVLPEMAALDRTADVADGFAKQGY